ncbi:MAG: MobA/MobL family protein [Planctomycetaceae bacterium]|nr:MobA/MobL family protein [Planctomycetaceae bacterium]
MNDRTGRAHDYRYKQRGIVHKEFIFPEGVAAVSRPALWNLAEAAEKPVDAKMAREYELALPDESPAPWRAELARRFAREIVRRYGVVADICIHKPNTKGDQRNHHAHIPTTTRNVTSKGFGEKTRILDSPRTSGKEIEEIRAAWERICNTALEKVGSLERVDRRTLKAQGIDRQPTTHLGPSATEMERRGVKTERGAMNRAISNKDFEELARDKDKFEKLKSGIEQARCRIAKRRTAKARLEYQRQRKKEERESQLNLSNHGKTR